MRTIVVRNAHQAHSEIAYQLTQFGVKAAGRTGPVTVLPIPLTVLLMKPIERVVFGPNPFTQFLESLWMLSGQNQLNQFSQHLKGYTDGLTFHGAYGHRWRKHFKCDQIEGIIRFLDADPTCRRQVLSLWDTRCDLGNPAQDLPRSTQAYFQVDMDGKLEMMVTSRSTNIVADDSSMQFSFLQEYVATAIGREVGMQYMTTFNAHFYESDEEMVKKLAATAAVPPAQFTCPYSENRVKETIPLVGLPTDRWDRELSIFMDKGDESEYSDVFLLQVAAPMYRAYAAFLDGNFDAAYREIGGCVAQDWMLAGKEWLKDQQEKCKTQN